MSTTLTTTPPRDGLHAGTRAMLPLAISCAPFGVAVGATIAASNVDVAPTIGRGAAHVRWVCAARRSGDA